jgi:hypothetical protein
VTELLSFADALETSARPRAVWKVLHDPGRFPEWWAGLASIADVDAAPGAEGRFTAFLDRSLFQDMDPARPMVHSLRSSREEDRVVVSCLVADIEYDWRLSPLPGGAGTRIEVTVAMPERRAFRFELIRAIIGASIRRLAALAEAAG